MIVQVIRKEDVVTFRAEFLVLKSVSATSKLHQGGRSMTQAKVEPSREDMGSALSLSLPAKGVPWGDSDLRTTGEDGFDHRSTGPLTLGRWNRRV